MENERRLPLHPHHLDRIDAEVRARMIVERGYAADFQLEPGYIEARVGRVAERAEVIAAADVLLLPKPQAEEVSAIPEGRVLWGWPHCVQDAQMTQTAIDRRLTLIGFGATARGAVTALKAQGIHDIQVLTQRGISAVGSPIHSAHITQLNTGDGPVHLSTVPTKDGEVLLPDFLASHDIVVNCTLQDVSAPITYLRTQDLEGFGAGRLIIDVSCDEGMGFEWARPTGFEDPMFTVGQGVNYYAVDHSPSYLWNSATWEISEAILPFLRTVLEGPGAWAKSVTISRAIEIQNGTVQNPSILAFQGRESDYPHLRRAEGTAAEGTTVIGPAADEASIGEAQAPRVPPALGRWATPRASGAGRGRRPVTEASSSPPGRALPAPRPSRAAVHRRAPARRPRTTGPAPRLAPPWSAAGAHRD